MTFREVGPSSLTLRLSLITMASSCMFVGTVGVKKSSSETLADKKKFWKHEVYVALPAGDYVANMFTYGGPGSTATPNAFSLSFTAFMCRLSVGFRSRVSWLTSLHPFCLWTDAHCAGSHVGQHGAPDMRS